MRYRTAQDVIDRNSRPEGDCLVWSGGRTSTGYGHLRLGRRGQVRDWKAHRLAYLASSGEWEVPTGLYVCHKCDNPLCVKAEHLFLGTAKDNNGDALKKGRLKPPPHPVGDDHWRRRTCRES